MAAWRMLVGLITLFTATRANLTTTTTSTPAPFVFKDTQIGKCLCYADDGSQFFLKVRTDVNTMFCAKKVAWTPTTRMYTCIVDEDIARMSYERGKLYMPGRPNKNNLAGCIVSCTCTDTDQKKGDVGSDSAELGSYFAGELLLNF